MNITGIITEYNPFHNGHLYHLNEAKKSTNADGIICVMSGNFVQRGGPAIIDKWKRAEMAINNGVDLVIELPTYYAVASAEFFAKGSISILEKLGVVNNIFFGSESGNVDILTKIADVLVQEDSLFKSLLKSNLDIGLTFAKAREKSLIEYFSDDSVQDVLSSSNNILGIEYIKAILKLNSNIKPKTLKRQGANYNEKEISSSFSSATSIRELIKKDFSVEALKPLIPPKSCEIFSNIHTENYPLSFDDDMFNFIKYRLYTNSVNFNNLYEITEGLENKIIKEITKAKNYEDFILNIKSKRYTYSKISRLLTHIFLCLDDENFKDINNPNNLYARVLAFNKTGREMLSLIKANSSIPLITKVPRYIDNPLLKLDIQATKSYSILNNNLNPNSDYLISPIIKY